MKPSILTAAAIITLSPFALPAGESLFTGWHPSDPAAAAAWHGGPITIVEDTNGELVYRLTKAPNNVRSREPIAIHHDKTYEVSGWFRSPEPEFPTRFLLDVVYLDADGEMIHPRSVWPISGTSVLAEYLGPDATTASVVATDWELPARGGMLAFEAREDNSDLPNSNTVSARSLEQNGDVYTIQLGAGPGVSYPKGTRVRLQRYLDYPRVSTNECPPEWTRFSFRIAATPPEGSPINNFFWPGAETMQVIIRNNHHRDERYRPDQLLDFKDVCVVVVSEE